MQSFAGKNVLVTGATGAIGGSVCRKLIKAGVGKLVMFLKDRAKLDSRIDNACKSQNGINNYIVDVLDLREPLRIEQKFSNAMK
jgi:NAD(P)-dependent dehydrogenase (short-subunit alcohol dehydrogenase family)